MIINRQWAMPNKNTFNILPIKQLINKERGLSSYWVDPFSGNSIIADARNDINPNTKATNHIDALLFLKGFESNSIDGVLFDPPYSVRQLSECYHNIGLSVTSETTRSNFWTNIRKEIARIVKPNGKVISFGWNSVGIGKTNGFKITTILIVCHGGIHNDTICTVEHKIQTTFV